MNTEQNLRNVLAVIQERGWTKNTFQDHKGQVCLIGGLERGVHHAQQNEVIDALWRQLPGRVEFSRPSPYKRHELIAYNDASRTFRRVKKLIRQAIKAEAARRKAIREETRQRIAAAGQAEQEARAAQEALLAEPVEFPVPAPPVAPEPPMTPAATIPTLMLGTVIVPVPEKETVH
jgi:hypothetical protein